MDSTELTCSRRGGLRPGKQDSGGGNEEVGDDVYKFRIAREDALKGSMTGETLSADLNTERSSAR